MKLLSVIVVSIAVLVTAIMLGFRSLSRSIDYPVITDQWWGEGAAPQTETQVTIKEMAPINFPEEAVKDLQHRLANANYFQSLKSTHWEYGANIADLKNIVNYWLEKYNWRNQEKLLNSYKHYIATIDGIKVHYVHVKPAIKTGKVIPILFAHGWPGSFYEFYKIIRLLTSASRSENGFSFEIICPSLPGFIFSEAAHKPGLNPLQIAKMFTKLMSGLGFTSYYVQGGDWGSLIVRTMGVLDPSHIKGVHLNFCLAPPPYGPLSFLLAYMFPSWSLGSEQEQHKILPLKNLIFKLVKETGYSHLHATKPDSIGVALNDSPVGLAAYIIEKFFVWSGCGRNDSLSCLESHFTKDELLTNVMLYWLTGSMPSAMRLYKENDMLDKSAAYPLSVPTGVAEFPHDLLASPYNWLHTAYPNIVQFTRMPRGGHFAAFEEPQLLAEDIRKFVTKIELG